VRDHVAVGVPGEPARDSSSTPPSTSGTPSTSACASDADADPHSEQLLARLPSLEDGHGVVACRTRQLERDVEVAPTFAGTCASEASVIGRPACLQQLEVGIQLPDRL
jgi:hypothetical protein